MQQHEEILIDNINTSLKTISVAKVSVIVLDEGQELRSQELRRAFVPGEIEAYKEFTGQTESPEIDYLNSIWTQEVIDNYNAVIAANEE